jgi:hypothetical protein
MRPPSFSFSAWTFDSGRGRSRKKILSNGLSKGRNQGPSSSVKKASSISRYESRTGCASRWIAVRLLSTDDRHLIQIKSGHSKLMALVLGLLLVGFFQPFSVLDRVCSAPHCWAEIRRELSPRRDRLCRGGTDGLRTRPAVKAKQTAGPNKSRCRHAARDYRLQHTGCVVVLPLR